MRAIHSRVDPKPLFLDPWGDVLVPDWARAKLEQLAEARTGSGLQQVRARDGKALSMLDSFLRTTPAYTNVVTRTRFSEDAVLAAASRGITQYVLIGAGFDSFALRAPAGTERLGIFEIDHPATQGLKLQRFSECGVKVDGRVRFVPANLMTDRLDQILGNCGFDRNSPAIFSWLGVTMYLTRNANLETLRAMAGCAAAGSELVFNYVDQLAFDGNPSQMFVETQETVTKLGEPFLSGFHAASLAEDLHTLGLELLDDISETDLAAAYDPADVNALRPIEECRTARARIVR